MKDIRKKIDEVDEEIIELLAKRMPLVKEITAFKRSEGLELKDKLREQEIRDRLKKLAQEKGLSEEFVDRLYTNIFVESYRIQEQSR